MLTSLAKKNIGAFMSPTDSAWENIAEHAVAMMPTPLAMQPTQYIRESWQGKSYGRLEAIYIASVHDSEKIALRISWAAERAVNSDFPDALAVAMPIKAGAPLVTMGATGSPIQILRWSAKTNAVESIVAEGIGSSRRGAELPVQCLSDYRDGRWSVVLVRPFGKGKDIAPLAINTTAQIGFAIWQGANEERAGIKAFSGNWSEMTVPA